MNILIAGCGDIGIRLGKRLITQGHSVTGLRRNPSALPDNFYTLAADLNQATPLTIPDNINVIYYIVAATARNDDAYRLAYVTGLQNLINATQNHQIKHLFFISSTSVFGQSNGESVNEHSKTDGSNFSTKRLLEAEYLVNALAYPSTVVRFGGIYGEGRTHLIKQVLSGKAHCTKGVYSNRIHSDDCAGLLAHLLTLDKPKALYIGVDNHPTLTCDVVAWLAEQLSIKEMTRQAPSDHSRLLRSNKRLSNARIIACGYSFIYPSFKEGYLSSINHIKQNGND